jgi:hypothetical protein
MDGESPAVCFYAQFSGSECGSHDAAWLSRAVRAGLATSCPMGTEVCVKQVGNTVSVIIEGGPDVTRSDVLYWISEMDQPHVWADVVLSLRAGALKDLVGGGCVDSVDAGDGMATRSVAAVVLHDDGDDRTSDDWAVFVVRTDVNCKKLLGDGTGDALMECIGCQYLEGCVHPPPRVSRTEFPLDGVVERYRNMR